MDPYDFEALLKRPIQIKTPELSRGRRLKHVIFSSQFDRSLLESLFRTADMIRTLHDSPKGSRQLLDLLPNKSGMLYFTQPSTRTYLSFSRACKLLGMACDEVRDVSVSSQVAKKESEIDSILMFFAYHDVIIMRSKTPNLAERCAFLMNEREARERRAVPIINGGAGADQHPTQALLDIYTLRRTFQFDHREDVRTSRYLELRKDPRYGDLTLGLDNKTYAFCGDLGRGRTVRSLVGLLSEYDNVTMYFIAPEDPTLSLDFDLRNRLINRGVNVHEFNSLDASINGRPILTEMDCLYMTRVQQEHDNAKQKEIFSRIDFDHYHLNPERVASMKDFAPILHPFPRDSQAGEIPTSIDTDPRAMYFRQARNGLWARSALLVHLFDEEDSLVGMYSDFTAERAGKPAGVL